MKRRKAGRRVRHSTGKGHAPTGRTTARREAPLAEKERRQLLQLVVCAVTFVLLVAVKLLLPARMVGIRENLSLAMERNMDVQSVFRAVGRAFSGEDDVAEAANDVYQAVFHPEETAVPVRTSAPAALATEDVSALETLQEYRREWGGDEEDAELSQASTLAYILYSEENLPECVSLEQAMLGFAYTSPLPGAAISSGFGYREHPTEGEERFHYGVDLAADTGTDIACFAKGTVTAVGESSSYGKYCIVAHEGGYSTLYAHCSRIITTSGKTVELGETIAEVGESGMATGPHLHFELQRESVYLNPVYYVSVL